MNGVLADVGVCIAAFRWTPTEIGKFTLHELEEYAELARGVLKAVVP